MNLHEYQAKNLLKEYGVPVPNFEVVFNAEDAISAANNLGTDRWVVKAQVHAGGRGKAGGVKLVDTKEELLDTVKDLLGRRLVTFQTDERGQPINSLVIEEPSNIASELYLGAVVDRASQRVVFMASTEGGMDIEGLQRRPQRKLLRLQLILKLVCSHFIVVECFAIGTR